MQPLNKNTLIYGDNLVFLRDRTLFLDESIDLVYLDPPFNSNRNYNVLFKDESGRESEAQINAFDDTWHWDSQAAETYYYLTKEGTDNVGRMIEALRQLLGTNQMMAYLVMMTPRLVELHRVLKATGSLYLHCDPTASHYLKLVLDTIFGPQHFRNEIVWKRSSAHSDTKQGARHYGRITDTILFYSKSNKPIWNPQYRPYDASYIERDYRRVDEDGRRYRIDNLQGPGGADKGNPYYEVMGVWRHWRYSQEKMNELIEQGRVIQTRPGAVPQYKRYLDEMPGIPLQNLWDDVLPINNRSKEMLGYPTQKPLALLERIIKASSNPGDLVLDPFCGCGTAITAAEKLGRRWIGIDITSLAVALQSYRLRQMFPDVQFQELELPEDLQGAHYLLKTKGPFQFQGWALTLVKAFPRGSTVKKGADRGIDGILTFLDGSSTKRKLVLVQVKSGANISVRDIRDLRGTIEREGAAIGVLITLHPPTRAMRQEATDAGYYEPGWWGTQYPRLQILTIEELLHGTNQVEMPPELDPYQQPLRVLRENEAKQYKFGPDF